MRSKSGVARSFERLSDRVGVKPVLQLISHYVKTAPGSEVVNIPTGTSLVTIVALGGGGGGGAGCGGAGGGSVEYSFAPPTDGLTLNVISGTRGEYQGPGGTTTVTLPNGLGVLTASGGGAGTNIGQVDQAAGGSGSGPPGSVIWSGGNNGRPGAGPFAGESFLLGANGGGGASPIGGVAGIRGPNDGSEAIKPGSGGGGSRSAEGGYGAVSIKFYGSPP